MSARSQKVINTFILFVLFFYVSIYVLVSSFGTPTGFISSDSSNYLRLAERILSGHGFFVPADGRSYGQEQWFAVWPVGYSSLISATSWVSGLSVFAASKVLNSLLMCANILMLYTAFGRNGLIASLVLLTAGTLEIYTITWSEAPFLTSLIGLVLFFSKVIRGRTGLSAVQCVFLFLLLIFPFLFRYIGLFVMFPSVLLAAYLFKSGRSVDASKVAICIITATVFCVAYLLHNALQTGHATGMERISAPETNVMLARQLLIATIQEFILIFPSWRPGSLKQDLLLFAWVVVTFVSCILVAKRISSDCFSRFSKESILFFVFGATYLLSIIYIRWLNHFDGFSFRLLDPGFSLLFLGLAIFILQQKPTVKKPLIVLLVLSVFAVASVRFYSVVRGFDSDLTYSTNITNLQSIYEEVPNGAIVVFATREMRYLRPDIQISSPKFRPYSAIDERWDDFISSLDPRAIVYIQTGPTAISPGHFHETVQEAVNGMPLNELFPLLR
jgi:hypothetical protein